MTQVLLSSIIKFSQDAIISCKPDLSINSWNHAAEKLFGYNETEILGKDLSIIFSSELLSESQKQFERIKTGENIFPFDAAQQCKDGRLIYVSISCAPIQDSNGEVTGFAVIARDVTERRQTEDALRESEEKYRTLVDTANEGIWYIDKEANTLYVNNRMAAFLGYEPDEIIGRKVPEFCFKEDVTNAQERVTSTFQGNFETFDFRFRRKDGSSVEVLASTNPVHDSKGNFIGALGMFTDITERKRVEGALDESELRFRNMADSAPVLIWVCDTNKLCTWVNKPWLAFTGRTIEQEMGNGWLEGLHPDDYQRGLQTYNIAFDELKPFNTEFRLQRHDGEYRWVVNRGVPMFANDHSFIGYIGSCTDITVRKEIENVREELLLRERQARAEAEAANRAKDEFLAVISHELRAPLNAMYGWARILQTKREQVDAATLAHAIDIIERSARTQSKLIEDLIDTTRIRTGKLRLDSKPVDLANLVQAAVDTARPSAKEKRITLAAVINTKAGIITGDPERLQQIIGNLLSNAIKFTPEGGHVSVRLERNDPNAQIFVTDTGIGIGADMLPHIFDRFYQVDKSSTTRGHGGLGLGLSLAQQLTELHGGTIQAVSAGKGQGATFVINLPLRALRGTGSIGPVNTGTLRDLNAKVSLEGVHVLCVDDERDARDLVTALLERFGAKVTAKPSAADALKALNSEEKFDVLVSDISMPGEDGYSLIRKIRALPPEEGGKIPAIALTAFSRLEDKERTREEGYDQHVAKPVEPMKLVHTINELVQPKTKAKGSDVEV